MRMIETHRLAGGAGELNQHLCIEVLDEPGAGGACHVYKITSDGPATRGCVVSFQLGPVGEVGLNGVSNEALLAIVQDRLEGFQKGAFACAENQRALGHVRDALIWLGTRTRGRVDRGVEGTSKP